MALPLYDSQPTRRAPLVTYFLIAANVGIFLVTPMADIADWFGQGLVRECAREIFVVEHGAIPKELISNRQVPPPAQVLAACDPQPYRKTPWLSAFSSMFLHSGWVHLLGNMIYLFVFGQATEDRLGRWRFLLFYLACGLVAAYGFALTYPDSNIPLVGASGAIAGVLGSHLVMYPRSRTIALVLSVLPFRLPAWVVLGQFFIFQWLSLGAADESSVAYVAHIYGFVAGVAVGLWARRSRAIRRVAAQGGWR